MKRTLLKRRTELKSRTPLKQNKPLKHRTGLESQKPIKKISERQKAKNALWNKITDERATEECHICQWCHHVGQRFSPNIPAYLDGHHIVKRRYNVHTKENCYILHRFKCHSEIEDNNVDVRIFKDRESWPRREK